MKTETAETELEELRRELAYLRRIAERSTGHLLMIDGRSIAMRHELEQKRRGFRLMAELAAAVGLGQESDYDSVFVSVSRRLNATLNMQRTAILVPEADSPAFRVSVFQGYPPEERKAIEARRLEVGPELLRPLTPVLITGADPPERLAGFREALKLPFLISSPVLLNSDIVALLVTGRLNEQRPFQPRLGASDVETVQTVSAYLAALMAGHRLAEVEDLANYDPLTRLPNLRRTKDGLRQILLLAKRGGFKAAVMFVDLDGFKAVNDTYCHAAGDEVLRVVAQRMRAGVRESDLVGRIGGDEFVAVLASIANPEDAGAVAGKIIEKLAEPIDIYGTRCQVGASIGIAVFPDCGAEAGLLLKAADEAMYEVKKKGKNAFFFAGGAPRPKAGSDR